MSRNTASLLSAAVTAIALMLFLTACRSQSAEPLPTRTPAPTFTPTAELVQTPVDPAAAETARAAQPAPDQPAQPAADQPAVQPPPEPPPTDTPLPPPTPVPAAEAVINTDMNVRGGPGTHYNIVGSASAGERYPIRGKNDAGSWWQIDFRGQDGWVFGDLISAQNTQSVAIAQNIPAPPPPTPVPPTPPPPPPAATQPPAPPPEPSYQFNKAILQRCDPNEGVTYVEGTTYRSGQPTNGLEVAFSYAVDGPVVATVQSGPHQGYEGWRTGFYSHILSNTGAREGDWYFWIVDDTGRRISKAAHVHTDGSAGDGRCQQAVIDFDS